MKQPNHFFQITDEVGTSGQPTADQFADIAAAGYDTVINLAMHNSDRAIPEEGNIVAEQGMTYIHLPVPFDNPTAEHLKKFIGIMSALDGNQVWVHCVVNKRVSAFMYHYLTKVKGVDEQRACTPILTEWTTDMEDVWRSFMKIGKEDLGL
jgi:protein tyrosine phosphatase (PTP) superfamily phosphohydrolase (DUF442 family)